jgi:hypothetical protein
MTEVTCEVIPLYKFSIYMKSDDKKESWGEYIISDTISGIQKKIIDLEIECGVKLANSRKSLCVSDFLLMPCDTSESKHEYRLFDIDNHDCLELLASHGEEYYYCTFTNGYKPTPVSNPLDDEKFVSEIKCGLKCEDDVDNILIESDVEEGFARIIYNGTLKHPYRRKLINKEISDADLRDRLINTKLQQMIHLEDSVKPNKE